MYIESVPNRNSPPCTLLRESYREGGKVKKRTIANLSKWPPELIENFRALLRGGTVVERLEKSFEVTRSRPYGHVAAVLGTLRKTGLDRIIGGKGLREHALSVAMIVARIIDPQSKLATARGLKDESMFSALAEELGVEQAGEPELCGCPCAKIRFRKGPCLPPGRKARRKRTKDNLPVHSFRTLLC